MSAEPPTFLETLPGAATARLPDRYRAAKKALAECSQIDECKDWADKAQALASYARQAKDDQLRKLADRIQARAVRRCGELLKQIPSAAGARTDLQPTAGALTRSSAAADAGLSEYQKVTALRVASVPERSFQDQVESDAPPTVTELAQQGTRRLTEEVAPPNPMLQQLRRFARFCGETDAASLAASVPDDQKNDFKALIGEMDSWLDQFITSL